jgi:hypothetical protein
MSEHQYIAFRAIDKPVANEDLEYMRKQSSRAEITPWSFDNEYHFGDFRGNAVEMLRRGYDLHLHYANYGTRKLLIRFPHGLPNANEVMSYFGQDSLKFKKDEQGPGGILWIAPYHESGDLEELWGFGDLLNRLAPLRAEILDGDLRPLYLAHLVMACDGEHDPEETKEAPVPAGLKQLSDAQQALTEYYDLSDALIAAAAEHSPPLNAGDDTRNQHAEWLKSQSQAKKDTWLTQIMSDAGSSARTEILAEFRRSRTAPVWPTVRRDRTIAELQAAAAEIQREANRKSVEEAANAKAKRLAEIAANPDRTLHETEQLVKQRTRDAYRQIAELLSDLRDSLAGSTQSGLAEQQAQKLKKANPTLRVLVSEMRRKGLLAK